MIWYVYKYGVVLTECGGDDGLLDSAIHHQPHAQAQQQRGNIITVQMFGLHMLHLIPALAYIRRTDMGNVATGSQPPVFVCVYGFHVQEYACQEFQLGT